MSKLNPSAIPAVEKLHLPNKLTYNCLCGHPRGVHQPSEFIPHIELCEAETCDCCQFDEGTPERVASPFVRCILCDKNLTYTESKDIHNCPGCGTDSLPVDPRMDVSLDLNWHELRIMTIWADNWARASREENPEMVRTLSAILRRIKQQYPYMPGLTISDEISELREVVGGGNVQVFGVDLEPVELPLPSDYQPPIIPDNLDGLLDEGQ